MFKAEIVADSRSPYGERLTSFQVTFPRIILAEVNTHRMFSRNTSSSRAIPFPKMVEAIKENPFIPIAWQKDHKGMQGSEYWTDDDTVTVDEGDEYERYTKTYSATEHFITEWLEARDLAIAQSYELNRLGVTKQLANRLLEPFMWTTMLITTGEEGLQNFFELRCPKYEIPLTPDDSVLATGLSWKSVMQWEDGAAMDFDTVDWLERESFNNAQAEIHIQKLAELMYDAYNESEPEQLYAGQWHIPYADKINTEKLMETTKDEMFPNLSELHESIDLQRIKIATALAARVSYTSIGDDKELDYPKLVDLHDRLIDMRHDSPLEHCARAMSDEEYQFFIKGKGIPDYNLGISSSNPVLTFRENEKGWCNNFKGFISYRYLIENEE